VLAGDAAIGGRGGAGRWRGRHADSSGQKAVLVRDGRAAAGQAISCHYNRDGTTKSL
jgi:hypothetical protein